MVTENIYEGASSPMIVKSSTISGLAITVKATASAAANALDIPLVDWDKVTLKVNATIMGEKHQIWNGAISRLLVAQSFLSGAFKTIQPNVSGLTHRITLAQDTGVKETAELDARVFFGGPIAALGADQIEIYFEPKDGAFNSEVDTAVSYFKVSTIDVNARMEVVPCIEERMVKASEQSFNESFGDNVIGIYFVNLDKSGILTANDVLSTVQLDSDKGGWTKDISQLKSERAYQFEDPAEADLRSNSFILHSGGPELDDVSVVATFTSSNVTASKNSFIVMSYKPVAKIVNRAAHQAAKHGKKLARKFK